MKFLTITLTSIWCGTFLVAHTAVAAPNSCSEYFETGLQVHSEYGAVNFGRNSQLLNYEGGALNTPEVKFHYASYEYSCGTFGCDAGGSPALFPVLTDFLTTTQNNRYIVMRKPDRHHHRNYKWFRYGDWGYEGSKKDVTDEITNYLKGFKGSSYKGKQDSDWGGWQHEFEFAGDWNIDYHQSGDGKLGEDGINEFRRVELLPKAKLTVSDEHSFYIIKKLKLHSRSVLSLPAGDYWVENFYQGSGAQINVIGEGTVRLFVKNFRNTGRSSYINASPDAIGDPAQFVLYSQDKVHFGVKSVVSGFIVAKHGFQMMKGDLHGAINAEDIRLHLKSKVYFRGDRLSAVDLGPVCETSGPPDRDGDGVPDAEDAFPDDPSEWADLDGDGIGDNSDTDRDGDGISNDYETQAGTDPDNALDVPSDLDADGIPDVVDLDVDGDGVYNDADAFPTNPNEWGDLDGDGIGDNADLDRDGDGIRNDYEEQVGTDPDNALDVPPDLNGDGVPDAIDPDVDGDGIVNEEDAFPTDPDEWADLDGDGIGNNSDPDVDGDGVLNAEDPFPSDPNEWSDIDGDGIGDNSDNDRDGDGVNNDSDAFPDDATETSDLDNDGVGDNSDPDRDGDGISNDYENQLGTDPNDPSSLPADLDSDGIPDDLDNDRDEDGVDNSLDVFPDNPGESADLDGDGIGDNSDSDRDGDGISNEYEEQSGTSPDDPNDVPSDLDSDGIPDGLDQDVDGDGVNNDDDAFPYDPTESADFDNDGVGNNADTDDDNDGVEDANDAFPFDPAESVDTDSDGVGNNADTDDDNDNVLDVDDAFPLDPTESADLDSDGIGDNSDTDRDGDGVNNDVDLFPNDGTEITDFDNDGVGDNADLDDDNDGVNDFDDAFPFDPNESSDLDGDGIGDNVDTDRDGDGVENANDLYPNDATRSQHPVVQNASATANQLQIDLSWAAPSNTEHLAGYNVYRADYGSDSYTLMNAAPLTNTNYNDASVVNGQAYSYQIAAVATINAIEGERSADLSAFVAVNQSTIENLTANRSGFDASLTWQGTSSAYRVYRSADGNTYTPISDESTASYTDVAPDWQQSFSYRVNTLESFTNPITGANLVLEGPVGPIAAITAIPALQIQLSEAVLADDGIYEISQSAQGNVSIQGTYNNAVGVVSVTADANGEQTSQNFDAGAYSLILDTATASLWTITVSEATSTPREASLQVRFIADTTAPELSLQTPASVETNDAVLLIEGNATDIHSAIQSITLSSNRYPGQSFGVLIGENGYFYSEAPIEFGDNTISVVVTDAVGNVSQEQVSVMRAAPETPSLFIQSPASGSVVQTSVIDVVGLVYSSQEAEELKITLGGREFYPESALQPGVYAFRFDNVALTEGTNFLTTRVLSPAGDAVQTVAVLLQSATDIEQAGPPTIQVASPLDNSVVNTDAMTISGSVSAAAGVTGLTLDGQPLPLHGSNSTFVSFNTNVDLSSLGDGNHSFTLIATDGNGDTVQQQVSIARDTVLPVIELDASLSVDAVNTVRELPYPFIGSVSDSNLAGFTINGQSVELSPGAQTDEYRYNVLLNLGDAQQTDLAIVAWDQAGNRSSETVSLFVDRPVSIEIIAPQDGTVINTSDDAVDISVTARLIGFSADYEARVRIDDGQSIVVAPSDGLLNETLSVSGASASHSVYVDVYDMTGASPQRVSTSSRAFSVSNYNDIELALDRSEPENNVEGIEPNAPIYLYFNRPLDPSLLNVTVTETVHGLVYPNQERDGNGSAFKELPSLIEVNKDHEPVLGEVSILPDNRTIGFYPKYNMGYNGTVFVHVEYDGSSLGRFNFKVRPLPTLARGVIVDQLGQNISDIKVTLQEIERDSATDSSGAFQFGFGDSADKAIQGGLYTLHINPGYQNPKFGQILRRVRIEEGRFTDLPTLILPTIENGQPFRQVVSAKSNNVLASGELLLDLSNAQLNFTIGPDKGRDRGNLHVSFTPVSQLTVNSHPAAAAPWVYAMQPQGLEVEGTIGVSIAIPELNGSTDYAPPQDTLVLLVAFDKETQSIMPAGVGRIDSGRVVNDGPLKVNRLDYLGYVIVNEAGQEFLAQYRDQLISYQQLVAELRQILEAAEATQ